MRDIHTQNPPLALSCVPNTRDRLPAEWATALADQHLTRREPHAFDQHAAALRAVGILRRMSRHIADVYVVQPLGVGNRLGTLQSRHRRYGQVLQQVLRMKLRKMYRSEERRVGKECRSR